MRTSTEMRLSLVSVLFSIGMVMICAAPLISRAQTVTGGIRGVITDSSGATLPTAAVTARNMATNAVIKTTATNDGVYSISRILPGKYTVSFEAQSFKKFEITEVEVFAGKDVVLDAKLEPGAINDVVTIVGGAETLIERDTVQISATFQERKVQELPVNIPGQGLDRIAFLVPGVTQGFSNVNSNGPILSVNGNRGRSNNFTIDGVDNNDLTIGGPNYFVQNPAVVSEIQVVTNNFSAEYGRNQGAIINYISKSGGNGYHGSAFWEHLDNANFNSMTNLERIQKDRVKADQNLTNLFGYAVGGPVIKDKIFFFTTGFFRRNPGLLTYRTANLSPTPAGVQALKSAFPNNPAVQYFADYSPFSMPLGNPIIRGDVAQSSITVGGVTVPVAAVQRTFSAQNSLDEYTVRSDANLGAKHRLWGRFFRQFAPGTDSGAGTAPGGAGFTGFTYDIPQYSRQVGGGWTYTISNHLVNEFRFNYSYLFLIFGGGGSGGKGNVPHPDQIDAALTNLNLGFTAANGASIVGIGPATNLPQGRKVNSYQFNDNVSLTLGNHQFKTGIDFRKLTNIAPFLPFINGQFTFGDTTQLANNNPQALQVALGPATLSYNEFDHFYYFQDDWRIRPNLTLNLGVRYENTGQPINLLNQISSARENDAKQAFWRQDLPLEARVVPQVATDSNNFAPRLGFVYSPHREGWLGRFFGKDKTTIRGGYGIAYDPAFYNLLLNISTSAPLVFLTSAPNLPVPNAVPTGDKVRNAAIASGLIKFNTFDPRLFNRTIADPKFYSPYSQQWSLGIQRELFRNNVLEARYLGTKGTGLFQSINANPFIGNLVNGFSRNYFDPVTSTTKTMTFPGFPQVLPSGVKPLVCTDNPATPDNEGNCNGRLFQTGPTRERVNTAYSIYHSLQVRYDGRFHNQWTYGFSYTYSHAIDNTSEVFSNNGGNSVAVSQNPLDLTRLERGNSGFDARHVFTANFIWDLPFFKQQKGIVGRLLGGWQFNGILLVQPGRLFTPSQQLSSRNPYEDVPYMTAFFGTQSQLRPFAGNSSAPVGSVAITDVDACLFYAKCGTSGGAPIFRSSPTGFYLLNDVNKGVFTSITPNDARFIINGPGAAVKFGTPFGTVARNSYRGDDNENVDLSVFKNFRVTERVRFQYRLQMFNAFNHPNFGIPNSINLDNAGTTFFSFYQNNGGRRTISMGLSLIF